ncbi:Shikimate dehydrogenase (NADP(+)) [Buchnera aphidicola (Phyllaphis fagi)]|uniref:shikimate dehydrogenase n=1 Tax=Buchnera aphidicola TaxID=9 RepID=UPI0034638723
MIDNKENNYLLFGNPVNHSKSPIIYDLFSKQIDINFNYSVKCIEKQDFCNFVYNFFHSYGKGANVTVPFKEKAYKLSNILTERAYISGSVNTLKSTENNRIVGDNTDGIGLLYDLKRLNFINLGFRVLLIGAGGAARGIIPYLLSFNCSIDILNRTLERANNIVSYFKHLGCIKAIKLNEFHKLYKLHYNLIIHTTSVDFQGNNRFFIPNIIFNSDKTFFYDICYSDDMTMFLKWCKSCGAKYYSDGIGMLVSQAAYSFYFWNNILPNIDTVINYLNRNKKYKIYNVLNRIKNKKNT